MSVKFIVLFALIACTAAHLGPDKAQQYSGYVTINGTYENGAHLFYWLIESRAAKPLEMPLVLWLTGGPGCSSMMAALFENGPYTVDSKMNMHLNPNSWTEAANMLYVDNPVGTGFSYAESVFDYVRTSEEAGKELLVFMLNFYQKYPQYKALPFFIFSESYAPRYAAALGKYIMEHNDNTNGFKIPLAGIGMGDGMLSAQDQWKSYITYAMNHKWLNDAEEWLAYVLLEACYAAADAGLDFLSMYPCEFMFEDILMSASGHLGYNVNPYNWKDHCPPSIPLCYNMTTLTDLLNLPSTQKHCPPSIPLCYNMTAITDLLNLPSTQKALNIPTHTNWTSCGLLVHFAMIDDFQIDMTVDIPVFLEHDVPLLVYVGENDIICNYIGQEAWMKAMKWNGNAAFEAASYKNWMVGDDVAGSTKSAKGLTYLKIKNCGHLAPHDQPVALLQMLKQFLKHQPLA